MKRQFAVLAVLFFAITAPAHAGLTVTTSTTQAGAPADVTLDESFATATKHVVIHLPPGLVGNPNAAAKCSQASFNSLGCLPAAQVGTATANGLPGFVTREPDGLLQTTALLVEAGRIKAIYVMRNPDKLRHLEERLN